MQNKKTVAISLAVIVAFFIIAVVVYNNNQSQKINSKVQKNQDALVKDYSFSIGNEDAKVQLVEFFDPACGTCALFHPYVKEIMKQNKGDIKLIYRYAPFHKNSDKIVKILEASRAQDKFLQTLELTFVTQKYWVKKHVAQPNILLEILQNSKHLDMEKLKKDMKNPKYEEIIKQDMADVRKLGVNKTPSYFVNGELLEDFGLEQLINLIESKL
ncbi:MAG: DsbA family protein [Campylobacterota bacterium]